LASRTSPQARQTRDLFRQLREMKAERYAERGSVGMASRPSGWSVRGQENVDIPGASIVRLHDIKRRMGTKVDLFEDSSLYGFDRKKWETQLFEKFPLDVSKGFKHHIGSFIKTSSQKRAFLFSVQRKATEFQINSLIAVIESKTPPFIHVTTYIKRKVWEELYNINSLYSLKHFVQNSLKETRRVFLKVTW